jgi:hypothetical protein
MIDCILKFLNEKDIFNFRIILSVVTFNLLNCIVDDLFIPLTEWLVSDTYLDHTNIVIATETNKNPPIILRGSRVVKKLIFWIIVVSIVMLIMCK